MASIKLDFAKVKHLKSDDKSTTLQHQDGHTITLAHKSLSPENQKALAALSQISKQAATPQQADQMKQMAEGGITGEVGSSEYRASLNPSITQNSATRSADLQQGATGDKPDSSSYDAAKKNWESPTTYTPEQLAAQKAAGYKDGGKVADKSKPCPMCGGGMSHYDEGGPVQPDTSNQSQDVTSQTAVPNYKDPMAASQQTPSDKPQIDAQTKRTEQVYNRMASNVIPKGMTAPISALQFGPNGELPAQPDPQNWDKAKQEVTQEKATNAAAISAQQQDIIKQNQMRAETGQPLLPVPDVPNGPQIPGSPENPPAPNAINPSGQPVQDNMDSSMQNMQTMSNQGYINSLLGIEGTGAAQAKLAQQQAKIQETNSQAQANVLKHYQDSANDIQGEIDAVRNDIQDNHITPENYWTGDKDGNGSHSKIATGIGMILAGFNPTNMPNAAVNFLKFQMEQNLNAQTQEMGKKQNVLSSLQNKFKNMHDTADFARIMNSEMVNAQLAKAAATATGGPNGLAANAALQAAGKLKMDYAPMQQRMQMSQAMMKMAGNPTGNPDLDVAQATKMARYMTAMGQPEQAKQWQQATIPGVGVSSNLQAIPDDVRKQIVSHKSVNDLMNMSLEFSKQPMPTNPVEYAKYTARASAIQGQLIGQIKQAQHDGVYKPSEAEFLTSQIGSSPGSVFRDLSSIPKIQELQNVKQTEYNELLHTYGLPSRQLPRANMEQPQYKTVNGVKYMRGPNGEAVPVK